ncbi:MAG: hypothetical protein KIT84_20220 [Labilithrix sp.]|nr:hypothetical protein [Labilithrix sp.]MCW5813366.1 hypothetical protein [Labilithrix sp.]
MNVALPPLPVFSIPDARIGEGLIAHVQSVNSFAAVAAWDRDANAFASYVKGFLAAVPNIEYQIGVVEQHARHAHASRGFFEKTFGSPPMTAEIQAMRQQLRVAVVALTGIVEQLESLIDQTPDNPEEKKALLADLKALKKELSQEKKELSLAMREVRANARRAGANVGGFFSTPRSRRYERMQIRFNKEAALQPHEDEKAAIERRIMSVERLILWVERIN